MSRPSPLRPGDHTRVLELTLLILNFGNSLSLLVLSMAPILAPSGTPPPAPGDMLPALALRHNCKLYLGMLVSTLKLWVGAFFDEGGGGVAARGGVGTGGARAEGAGAAGRPGDWDTDETPDVADADDDILLAVDTLV